MFSRKGALQASTDERAFQNHSQLSASPLLSDFKIISLSPCTTRQRLNILVNGRKLNKMGKENI
jgi:hypothetical protein